MKYYLNFIFIVLFVQLLVVQTKDPALKIFYQKLLNTRNQTKVLSTSRFSTKSRSPVFHPHTFYDRFYFKAQTSTSTTAIHTLHAINKRYAYRTCHPSIRKWGVLPQVLSDIETDEGITSTQLIPSVQLHLLATDRSQWIFSTKSHGHDRF